jgi:hypothetical protein
VLQPFVEQGLLVGTTGYFLTSNVLEREYGDEEHPLGGGKTGSMTCSIR